MRHINRYYKIGDDGFVEITKDQNGQPFRFVLLKSQEAKRYAAYTLINKDLDSVISALKELVSENKSVIIQQSLMAFAVITYVKCFLSNKGRGTSLNEADIFKDAEKSIKDDHNKLLKLRHDYIAHAGSEFDKCLVAGTIVTRDNFILAIDVNSFLFYVVNMPPKIKDLIKLCLYVKQKTQLKSEKVLAKLSENVALNAQNLYKDSIMPDLNNIYKKVEVKSQDGMVLVDFMPVPLEEF